jgi:surface antigen
MYYGKGYCTDYVNSRLGTHIRGDAATWSPNVAWQQVQKGDAAIFKSIDHVAYVEDVVRDSRGMPVQIKVSEMNYGAHKPGTNPSCIVTVNFGRVTTRVTSASSAQYYRRR